MADSGVASLPKLIPLDQGSGAYDFHLEQVSFEADQWAVPGVRLPVSGIT